MRPYEEYFERGSWQFKEMYFDLILDDLLNSN